MTATALREQISSGDLAPLYLIEGDDEAEKATLAAAFADAVEADLRAFNVERIYGVDATRLDQKIERILALVDAARTLPMLAARRVVIVVGAERLMEQLDDSEAADRAMTALTAYIREPEPQTTVVFLARRLDGRRTLTRLLRKQAVVVECANIADIDSARGWVADAIAAAGVQAEPEVVRLIAAAAGPDIVRLRDHVERLLLFTAGQRKITAADAREIAGPAVAHDEWAIVNALRERRLAEALRQLALILDAGGVPYMILGQIRSFIERDTPAARLPMAMEALFRTDLALKSSGGDPRVLLERLIVELCD